MVVYLAVEAGCTGAGPGLRLFNPPVPTVMTLVATAVAAIACLGFAGWAHLRWRANKHDSLMDEAGDLSGDPQKHDHGGSLAFAGFLLSLISFVAILFVGLPALVLPAC
jgi:hypothetical protein